jgi:uncharacterized protein
MMKIVIAGATGFIGSHLVAYFKNRGYEVLILSRKPESSNSYFWDPYKQEMDITILEGSDCVINLAGENIQGRWTEKKKEEIKNSRLAATQFLCSSILQLAVPPKVYIGASAIGYYGDRGNEILDEDSPSGEGFLAEVCRLWEKIPEALSAKGVRVILTRFGIVMGRGGSLKQIEKAFRTGMGGVLGSGKQMMSWISIDDLCAAMDHLIEQTALSGPVNFVAPQVISNADFTKALGKVLNRPTMITVPKFALNLLFGEAADMFLASTHVRPKKLEETGYRFLDPEIEKALVKYLS